MMNPKKKNGFTLIEILLVVMILGLLAGIAMAKLSSHYDETRINTFVTNLKCFADAEIYYRNRTGELLEDSSSGEVPAGWADYIDTKKWLGGTPVGGVWDFEQGSDFAGMSYGFGVHFDGTGETRGDDYMQKVDEIFDDGDLAEGAFQKIANDRYYYIILK